ncbi:MAG: RagB/SusD family nutrient uptake outer membrane protein [Tannerella sp.]|jgi:hypothetical protein|nr:RagB/SusD family nutrient uptake outer membrane protein [Tannerella sp.]
MKKIVYLLIACTLCACDDYLDIVPDNVATIDYAFRNRFGAEKYLFTCYTFMPNIGHPAGDPAIMGGDDIWSHEDMNYYGNTGNFNAFHIKQGFQNSDNPLLNFWNGTLNGRALFRALRDCNIFLENIDKVGPDLSSSDRIRWKAEVKFLKAYYHYYLLRMYGPIPLVKENLPVAAGINDVRIYRDPFDECVDYTVELLDEAARDLPPSILDMTVEMGRITRAIALSVKAELLVMAASPLFNGNPDFADMTDNRNIRLFEREEDPQKWHRAAAACKEAVELCESEGIRLYEFSGMFYDLSDTTKRIMSCRHVFMDRWNIEIIWGSSRTANANDHQYTHLPFFTTVEAGAAQGRPIISPTLRMAELFYSNNGVPINEDVQYDYDNRYRTAIAPEDHKYYIQPGFETAILNMNREPRFYAALGFDGGVWFGNGRYKDIGKGSANETSWIMAMKRGEASGNYSGLRYSITGYWSKKGSHFESLRSNEGRTLTMISTSYPIIRLADLYLLYAEALNESLDAPGEEVYHYIDRVRKRAGLEGVTESWGKFSRLKNKPSTKDGMREIIRQERMIELAFEGKRFWDIRRWKTAFELLNQPVRGWNIMGSTTDEYYNVVTVEVPTFTTKEYLWPVRDLELRTNENLIQNPGW